MQGAGFPPCRRRGFELLDADSLDRGAGYTFIPQVEILR